MVAAISKRPFRLFLLLFILLLAFALRLHNLDAFSFWTDEGLTPLRSGYSIPEILSNRVTIQEGITKDTHPPLYYLIIHFTRRLFGETDFAYRYPSLLFGLLLVPLMFQFGRAISIRYLVHGTQSLVTERWMPGIGMATALLTAVNPLQIWYANEARMYTLFVLLVAAMSYILWQTLSLVHWRPSVAMTRSFILYAVLAGLALYTHYTAVFLIAAQGLFWVWLLWQRGQKKLIVGTAVLALLVALPLVPFTIPRLFSGGEAGYFYVSPFIMLQDVVHFFSLGLTTDFTQTTIKLLDMSYLLLAWVGLYAVRGWIGRSFLLAYLLATVLGLMAGSLIKPMYQGVRHIMVDSPAWLLLLGVGSVQAGKWASHLLKVVQPSVAITPSPLHLVILGFTLIGPVIALYNLYNDPTYAKDDFRSLARYVEQQAGEHDVIIYNNAILLPLHEHYRQRSDIAAIGLPVYPYTAVPDDPKLLQLSQTYERIWYVTDVPADHRDDDQLVRAWLDEHLPVVDSQAFHARTVVVSVIAYDTRTQLNRNSQLLSIQWPDLPPLQGIQLANSQPIRLPTLWFDLSWGRGPVPAPEAYLQFSLRGADGREWATFSQPIAPHYFLSLPLGMPPGRYTLMAQPAHGEAQPLTEIELAGTNEWPISPANLYRQMRYGDQPFMQGVLREQSAVLFDNGMSLQGIEFPAFAVRPGHNLPFTLYWGTETAVSQGATYQLEVVTPDGTVIKSQGGTPGASWLTEWPVGALLREDTALYFPPETLPGQYRLRWRLLEGEQGVAGWPFGRPWSSEWVNFGKIEVEPWPMETNLPANATLTGANFGQSIQLYGYDLEKTDTLNLTLYWQAAGAPAGFYVVFIHLVAADGTIVAQKDQIPAESVRPTSGWREGEVITDRYTFQLPPDLLAGEYEIRVGLYNPDNNTRLPVLFHGQPQANDQLMLTTVRLP